MSCYGFPSVSEQPLAGIRTWTRIFTRKLDLKLLFSTVDRDDAMTVRTFDRAAIAVILADVFLSVLVALSSWEWFPVPGNWGEIAHIPRTPLNYFALLSPWVILLAYLLTRRIWLKKPFRTSDKL